MNNTSTIVKITAAFLSLIFIFIYGVYTLFIKQQPNGNRIEYLNVFAPGVTDSETEKTQSAVLQTAGVKGEEAIATSAGEALGKVINNTIKNSSANLSGSGVHIKNSTDLNININDFLSGKLGYTVKKDGLPQVLILHTHATESFLSEDRDYYTSADKSRTTDNSFNVTALGAVVAEKLNAAGIKTLHDATQHDYPSYNQSYSRAAKTIKAYLKKHPSIKVVIDIHRDSVQNGTAKTKLTTEIGGKRAAQVMLVMGSQSGNVKNFPNWKENLKLAVRLQKNLEGMYPTLSRPLSLMSRSYNEPLTTGSMLIEIGTDANAFGEAVYSAQLLAEALTKTLES